MNTYHTGSRYPICEKCHKRQYERGQTFTPGDNCECSTNHTDSVEAHKEKAALILTPLIKQIFHGDNKTSELIHKEMDIAIDKIIALQATQSQQVEEAVKIDENTSDGYHTFKELYEFRLLYNAHLFNEWAKQGMYDVHKSTKHSDGVDCFGGGWFIVVASLPSGDISNHYEMKDWDLFQCHIRQTAKEWDGHTSQDVEQRLREALNPNHQD